MAYTKELLVLTTSTPIPRSPDTAGFLIQHRGPNTIWFAIVGTTPAANTTLEILPTECVYMPLLDTTESALICPGGNQVSGAATIITEVPR